MRGVVETIGPSTELERASATLIEVGRRTHGLTEQYRRARATYLEARAALSDHVTRFCQRAEEYEAAGGGYLDPQQIFEHNTPIEPDELDREDLRKG